MTNRPIIVEQDVEESLYCIPLFGHGCLQLGMGFGNRLFPWARCRLFAERMHAKMVSPIWFRPALNQLFRGGVSLRYYLRQVMNFGLFNNHHGDVAPLYGRMIMLKSLCISEKQFLNKKSIREGDRVVVVFRSFEKRPFIPLMGHNTFLKSELISITKKKYLDIVKRFDDIPIVINVRCGNDFLPPINGHQKMGHQKTSLKWYVELLQLVRRQLGRQLDALVVSDGTVQQLQPILDMGNTSLLEPRSAISDLLVMSNAKFLIASGASSFSAWGSFLGNMLCVSFPGQDMVDYWGLENTDSMYFQVNPKNPDKLFVRELDRRGEVAGI